VNENGTTQTSCKEKAFGKENAPDKMGAFLDSAEEIRQGKKGASWQAYFCKALVEKAEAEGLKWQLN
jgi:hypothetical protein